MPKNECDPQDPMERVGMCIATEQDTLIPMAECFIEELMWMGHSPERVLALFQDPHYAGPHLVLQRHGTAVVQRLIADTFAKWANPAPTPH